MYIYLTGKSKGSCHAKRSTKWYIICLCPVILRNLNLVLHVVGDPNFCSIVCLDPFSQSSALILAGSCLMGSRYQEFSSTVSGDGEEPLRNLVAYSKRRRTSWSTLGSGHDCMPPTLRTRQTAGPDPSFYSPSLPSIQSPSDVL